MSIETLLKMAGYAPEEIECIEALDLGGNNITYLPAEIGNLTNLQRLYLDGNALSSLPSEIGNLTNLQWLDLGGNALSSLR